MPVVAAYDANTGAHRWVACADDQGYTSVRAATGSRVFVALAGGPGRNHVDGPQAVVLGLDAKAAMRSGAGPRRSISNSCPRTLRYFLRSLPWSAACA